MRVGVYWAIYLALILSASKMSAQVQITNAFRGVALSSNDVDYSRTEEISSVSISFTNITCSWSDSYLFVEGIPQAEQFRSKSGQTYRLSSFIENPAFSGTLTATWQFPSGERMEKTGFISFHRFGQALSVLASEPVSPTSKAFFGDGIKALEQKGLIANRENLQSHGYGPKLIDLKLSIQLASIEYYDRNIRNYEMRIRLEKEGRSLYEQSRCSDAVPKLKAALDALPSYYVKSQFNLNDQELKTMIASCEDRIQEQSSEPMSTGAPEETKSKPSTPKDSWESEEAGEQREADQNPEPNTETSTKSPEPEAERAAKKSSEAPNYDQTKENFEREQAMDAQRAREFEQTRRNTELAASAGVAAILIHTYIGKLIYTGIPHDKNIRWTHLSPHVNMSLGYGFGVLPFHKKFGATEDAYNGGKESSVFTIDLNYRAQFDFIMAENYGLGATGNVSFGHFLEEYKTEYGMGAIGYLGHKNFKLLAKFQSQYVNFFHSSWIDASSKTSADLQYNIRRIAIGPRISWGKGQSSNLDLLLAADKIRLEQEGIPRSLIYGLEGPEQYTLGAKLQFWQQSSGLFYAEAYEAPNVSGEKHYMFKAGYLRSFDAFFNKPLHSFEEVLSRYQKKNKVVVSIMNPLISWGQIESVNRTDSSYAHGFGFKLIEVEKELDLLPFLSLSAGLGISMGRGFNVARELDFTNPDNQPNYLNPPPTISRGIEADLPLGLQFYLYRGLVSSFWLSSKYQISYQLYDTQGFTTDINEPISNAIRLGLGYDFAWSKNSSYRAGLYYLSTEDAAPGGNVAPLNSVQVQFALLF